MPTPLCSSLVCHAGEMMNTAVLDGENSVHRYERLQKWFTGCTYVVGTLAIAHIDQTEAKDGKPFDFNFLSTIREVYGSVLIYAVSVRHIPLTSLRVIRGQPTCSTCNGNALHIYLSSIDHIDLSNLTGTLLYSTITVTNYALNKAWPNGQGAEERLTQLGDSSPWKNFGEFQPLRKIYRLCQVIFVEKIYIPNKF